VPRASASANANASWKRPGRSRRPNAGGRRARNNAPSPPPKASANRDLRAPANRDPPAAPPKRRRPPNKTKGAPAVSRTLILVKPDAFERALTGEVIARFERKGLRIAAVKSLTATEEIASQHYAEHSEKPFFGELVSFITGGPLVALVFEGVEAVKAARQLIGATNPVEAAPGSIRGDL